MSIIRIKRPLADPPIGEISLTLKSLSSVKFKQNPSLEHNLPTLDSKDALDQSKMVVALSWQAVRQAINQEKLNTIFTPVDWIVHLYDLAYFLDQLAEQFVNSDTSEDGRKELLIKINEYFFNDKNAIKTTANNLSTQYQVDEAAAESYCRAQQENGFQDLIAWSQATYEHAKRVRSLIDSQYTPDILDKEDQPSFTKLVDPDSRVLLACGQPASNYLSQDDGGPGSDEKTQPEEGEKKQAKDLSLPKPPTPLPDDPPTPPTPQEYNSALTTLSRSYSEIILTNLVAAYTSSATNQQPIVLPSLSSIFDSNPALTEALHRQLTPQVENILLSLDPQELDALLNNKPTASQVRLKIFRKAHEFAIGYPPLRLLIQGAINQYYQTLSANEQEAVSLAIKENTVAAVQEKLQDDQSLLSSSVSSEVGWEQVGTQGGGERSVVVGAILSYQTAEQFEKRLGEILVGHGSWSETDLVLARVNLESIIASFIIADPLLDSSFIQALSLDRVSQLLGIRINKKLPPDSKKLLIELLELHWKLYRAKLNQEHAGLAKLSELGVVRGELTPKQQEQRFAVASHIRQTITGTSLAPEDAIRLFSEDENQGKDLLLDVKDLALAKKTRSQIKAEFLRSLDLEERKKLVEVNINNRSSPIFIEESVYDDPTKIISLLAIQGVVLNYWQMIASYEAMRLEAHFQKILATEAMIQEQVGLEMAQAAQMGFVQQMSGGFFSQAALQSNLGFLDPALFQESGSLTPASFFSNSIRLHGSTQTRSIEDQLFDNPLVAELVDQGVMAATGGALAFIPPEFRKALYKMIFKQTLERARLLLKMMAAAAAAIGLLLALLLRAIKMLGAIGTGALTGAGVGFLTPLGPLGAIIGGIIGGLAGFFASQGAAEAEVAATQASQTQQSIREAVSNVEAAGQNLLEVAKNQVNLAGSNQLTQQSAAEMAVAEGGSGVIFTTVPASLMAASATVLGLFLIAFQISQSPPRSPDNILYYQEERRLLIQKSSTPSFGATANTSMQYSIQVSTNLEENQILENVTLVDELDSTLIDPTSVEILSSTDGMTCSIENLVISCELPNLEKGSAHRLTYRARTVNDSLLVTPDGKTPIINKATVKGYLESEEVSNFTYHSVNGGGEYVALKSFELVSGLQRGWWGFYNYHPEYPNLFGFDEYRVASGGTSPPCRTPNNGCPKTDSRNPSIMYWCTWNVIHAFQRAGTPIPHHTGVTGMRHYFRTEQEYVGVYLAQDQGSNTNVSDYQLSGRRPTIRDAKIGDVAFMQRGLGSNYDLDAHVAIVAEITNSSITTYDSNNYRIRVTYVVLPNGTIEPLGNILINGFGRMR